MHRSARYLFLALVVCLLAHSVSSAQEDLAITIEPYTGPPVFLPEGEAPPKPRVVQDRGKKAETYKTGEKRIEREVAKYSDDSFVANGMYREYFKSGQVFVSGQFKYGKRDGEWVFYHENGELAKKVSYVNGQPDGVVETRDEKGALQARREYQGGKRAATWLIYAPGGEQVIREEHYVDGKPDGLWKNWFADGQLQRESPFKAGVREGVAKEWSEEGKLLAEVSFAGGKRDGVSTRWMDDGSKVVRRFKEGKLTLGE